MTNQPETIPDLIREIEEVQRGKDVTRAQLVGMLWKALEKLREQATKIAWLKDQITVLERETHTVICAECQGIGTVQRPWRDMYANTIVCPTCAGRGTVPGDD